MNIWAWVLSHKLLVFFVAATASFGISTAILGADNAKLKTDLENKENNYSTPPASTTAPSTPKPAMERFRLPTTAKPTKYDLYLYPDLETGLFSGKVSIFVILTDNPTFITLHSNKLNITSVKVENIECNFEVDSTFEQIIVTNRNGEAFKSGDHIMEIQYNGDMKNRVVGLYRSSYVGSTGVKRNIATSKFEPTYARQAFPCFDEPNLKAKFLVHLLKPKDSDYIALSNYPQASVEDAENGEIITFEETVPMSTYLACFIVSDFTSTNYTFDNAGEIIPFKVYASPNQLEKTKYAGEVGKKVIEHYVKYFGIKYPLPKLDMVAIPDFVSGAMEHWGLVTYRETALLYTDKTHSSGNKQRVATVIAHELAHSWFGNLVTMNWWNDLWLNEGFASYIEYKGVLAAEPTWGMLDQFLVDDLHPVLSLDATLGSHPIIQKVETPDQITEVFDTISYSKGASILRMLENTVGDENFQKGVTNYLKKFEYRNAITQNLLDELQAIMGSTLNVTEFMNTFTVQMGYPILNVKVEGDNYTFTQKRFLKDPDASEISDTTPYNYKWNVPITYVTDLGKSESYHMFRYNEESVTLKKPEGAKWIKFNHDQVGYYRVNYPEDTWRSLVSNYKSLSVADRTHLIEETFSIAEAGQLNYNIPLDLTAELTDELDYVPWKIAASKLAQIKTYLSDTEYETTFKEYVVKIVDPAYSKLTWTEDNNDSHLKRLSRTIVLNLACEMGHKEALENAADSFNNWITSGGDLSPDLRGIIYKYGMIKSNETIWNKLFDKFKQETDASEKLKFMNGLASIEDKIILKKLINLAKDETYVRSQDYFTLMTYISTNPSGTALVWDYVRENWENLVARFGLNERYLGQLIPSITSKFSSQVRLDEMTSFFAKYPEAGAGASSRVRALEKVKNNIKWLSKYKSTVEGWIETNKNI